MDTSKEYIKMSQAMDLAWKPQLGDFVFDGKDINVIIDILDERFDNSCNYWTIIVKTDKHNSIDSEELIPLYRQDQLQEMRSWDKRMTAREIVETFHVFISFERADYYNKFTSREQIELAFVMYELYQKTWNGKEWIKDTPNG